MKNVSMKRIFCFALCSILALGIIPFANAESDNSGDVTIYLTRHGKTMFNVTGQMQGWSDTPLIEDGIQIARALGAGLKDGGIEFDAVYAGDLNRQRMTAKYAMEELGIPYDDLKEIVGLREVCYGSVEGQPGDPVLQMLVEEHNLNAPYEVYVVLGIGVLLDKIAELDTLNMAETYPVAAERIQKALREIVADAQANGNDTVLAITSGMITNILIESLGGQLRGEIANCSVTKIVYHNGAFTIESIGDTSYLEKGQELLGITGD